MKRLYHYTPMLIISMITTVVMIIAELLAFCNTMVCDTDYYVWVISDSGADEALYNELDEYFTQLPNATDIPKEVYTKSLDKKKVSSSAKQLVKASMDYTFGKSNKKPEVKYDYTQYEIDVTEYIETYSEANNIEKDSEYYSLIDNTLYVTERKIDSSLDVLMAKKIADSSLPSITRRLVPSLSIFMGISVVLLLMLVGLMCYVDREHLFDVPYWVGSVMFCGSALLLVPTAYCRMTGYFDGLFLENESIYYAITGAIYGITDRVMLVNAGIFALGILLIIFTQVIHLFRVREAKRQTRGDID